MKSLKELTALEKEASIDLQKCKVVAEEVVDGTESRIVELDGRYFVHRMKEGHVTKCFEVAVSWRPFEGIIIFAYTPDDLHVYEVDSRRPAAADVKKLEESLVQPGMSCDFNGMTVTFKDDSNIAMNGILISVEPCSEFVFKLMARKIKAIGGARGLYCFLDRIAEQGKYEKYPTFCDAWAKIREKYAA